MRKRLPPLSALVVFEAVARHMSFTRAGAELGITQAAVSRQIRLLEEHLGVELLRRTTRVTSLTAAGRKLRQAVTIGLGRILTTADEIRRPAPPAQVTITTTIALASVWLMQRIAKFRAIHPDIDLKVVAADPILDLAGEGIDIGLRYGAGHWPGVDSELLFRIELFPICSPAFLERAPKLDAVGDLLHVTLLHIDEPNSRDADWAVWFKAMGVKPPPLEGGLHFNNYTLLIQAALNGQGVALGWGHLIDDYLASGVLVRAVDMVRQLEPAFYLAMPAGVEGREEVRLFRDWIVAETEPLRRAGPHDRQQPRLGKGAETGSIDPTSDIA